MHHLRLLILILVCYGSSLRGTAQTDVYRQYIETYKKLAIDQMQRYRIPASITMAQGLIESSAGKSHLAQTANNHFGIKVGSGWIGDYVLRSDDAPNERFRKYQSVEESYEDHSLFLSKRPRYASLFLLAPNDYRSWAYGLKAAGYATNPRYPEMLISVIERYDLARLDLLPTGGATPGANGMQNKFHHELYLCNELVYVVAHRGDSYERIAGEIGIDAKKLRRYNEVPADHQLNEGDIVFLAKKRKHVARTLRNTYHVVSPGESVYDIAQRYGIRIDRLYRWNSLPADYTAVAGNALLLK